MFQAIDLNGNVLATSLQFSRAFSVALNHANKMEFGDDFARHHRHDDEMFDLNCELIAKHAIVTKRGETIIPR